MGYPMCMNIHARIPSDAKLFICDVNQSVLDRFVSESSGKAIVTILQTPKEIAEYSVRHFHASQHLLKSDHIAELIPIRTSS